MEAVVTTGAINHANHHQQTNIQFFTGQMPFLSPNQQCQITEGKNITFHGLLPQAHLGVFQLWLWPLIAYGYLGGGLSCLSSALGCLYPMTDICIVKFKCRYCDFLFLVNCLIYFNNWRSFSTHVRVINLESVHVSISVFPSHRHPGALCIPGCKNNPGRML